MSEQTKQIMWMAEELDFEVPASRQDKAQELIDTFLENTAGLDHRHSVYPA